METLLNVNQSAFILKVHPLTIRRYIREGRLKAIKVGGNIRIKESKLSEFNTEVKPRPKTTNLPHIENPTTKIFTTNDPLFRLEGLGAHVELSRLR